MAIRCSKCYSEGSRILTLHFGGGFMVHYLQQEITLILSHLNAFTLFYFFHILNFFDSSIYCLYYFALLWIIICIFLMIFNSYIKT